MNTTLFHLQARSAFRFGQHGVEMENSNDHLGSDSLFGAMCYALHHLEYGPELSKEFVEPFSISPFFLISSAFPYAMLGDTPLRFYPLPLPLSHQLGKPLNDARWVSESVFLTWLRGNPLPKLEKLLAEEALVSAEEKDDLKRAYGDGQALWQKHDRPRVAIDRLTSAGNIFYVDELRFIKGGGLWFAYQSLNSDWTNEKIALILDYLSDEGLGGERSSGYGQFIPQSPITQNYPPHTEPYFVSLSHYSPATAQEMAETLHQPQAAYQLLMRRGWVNSMVGTAMRHRVARMVKHGAYLRTHSSSIYGRLLDVTPTATNPDNGEVVYQGPPLYRYAYAFPIGQ
jgi:CRISPR-associated protein Csm4